MFTHKLLFLSSKDRKEKHKNTTKSLADARTTDFQTNYSTHAIIDPERVRRTREDSFMMGFKNSENGQRKLKRSNRTKVSTRDRENSWKKTEKR